MLLGLEVLSRLVLGHAPRTRLDPQYDRVTLPHEHIVHASEGFSRGDTNELGHLDAPMPSPLPPDGVLVIGDSLTEGRQVDRAQRFTDRLGRLIERRVYNVGHTGWSPLNAIAFMAADLGKFAPRTVIVQVSGNDLDDMMARKRPHVVEGPSATLRVAARPGEAGAFERDGQFSIELPNRDKHGLSKRIADLKDAASRSALVGNSIVRWLMIFANSEDDGGAAGTCALPEPLAVRALPWVAGELHRSHADVRLLYLPVLDYHAGCIDRCAAARWLWHHAAEQAGLQIVDVTDALCRRFHDTRQPLNGFWNTIPGTGHLNSDGHEVVADELAAALHGTASGR
jgi:lysophospholipase L1-like esterase